MRAKNLVVKSINAAGEDRCVELFRRPDGTFGFEEYRRDIEDQRGWFAIGFYGDKTFDTEVAALTAALASVSWLSEAMGSETETLAPE
jgi:hypothetical protein